MTMNFFLRATSNNRYTSVKSNVSDKVESYLDMPICKIINDMLIYDRVGG